MDRETKLTLDELIRRKMQIQEAKRKRKKSTVYVESLGGCITLIEPTREIIKDIQNFDDVDKANRYAIYNCTIEPSLKNGELQEAYECSEPYDIVDKLFKYSEILQISTILNNMLDMDKGVTVVEEIKN